MTCVVRKGNYSRFSYSSRTSAQEKTFLNLNNIFVRENSQHSLFQYAEIRPENILIHTDIFLFCERRVMSACPYL